MAQKVTVQLVDDLDDSPIAAGDGRTVEFAFDGSSYEIDLSNDNVDKFRDAISDYIAAARKTAGRRTGSTGKSPSAPKRGTPRNSGRSASGPRRTGTRSLPAAVSPRRCRKRTQPHTEHPTGASALITARAGNSVRNGPAFVMCGNISGSFLHRTVVLPGCPQIAGTGPVVSLGDSSLLHDESCRPTGRRRRSSPT